MTTTTQSATTPASWTCPTSVSGSGAAARTHVLGPGRRQPHRPAGPHHGSDRRIRLRQIDPGQRRPRAGAGAVRQRTLLDEDITSLTAAQRRTLGRTLQAVFQDPNSSLNPSWTIGRSLAEPMRAQGPAKSRSTRTAACWKTSAWTPSGQTARGSSPADNANASRSPGR